MGTDGSTGVVEVAVSSGSTTTGTITTTSSGSLLADCLEVCP